jgi:hypothetical protein
MQGAFRSAGRNSAPAGPSLQHNGSRAIPRDLQRGANDGLEKKGQRTGIGAVPPAVVPVMTCTGRKLRPVDEAHSISHMAGARQVL